MAFITPLSLAAFSVFTLRHPHWISRQGGRYKGHMGILNGAHWNLVLAGNSTLLCCCITNSHNHSFGTLIPVSTSTIVCMDDWVIKIASACVCVRVNWSRAASIHWAECPTSWSWLPRRCQVRDWMQSIWNQMQIIWQLSGKLSQIISHWIVYYYLPVQPKLYECWAQQLVTLAWLVTACHDPYHPHLVIGPDNQVYLT